MSKLIHYQSTNISNYIWSWGWGKQLGWKYSKGCWQIHLLQSMAHYSQCGISITMANIQYVFAAWITLFTFSQAFQRSIMFKLKKKKNLLHYQISRNAQVQVKHKDTYMWVKGSWTFLWGSFALHFTVHNSTLEVWFSSHPPKSKRNKERRDACTVQWSYLGQQDRPDARLSSAFCSVPASNTSPHLTSL